MPKRSNGKRKGIQWGVQKHKIKSKAIETAVDGEEDVGNLPFENRQLLGIPYERIFKIAEKFYGFLFRMCGKVFLVPFRQDEDGRYVPTDLKARLLHYVVLSIGFASMFHKVVACSKLVFAGQLDMRTFICLSVLLVDFVSWCVSLATIMRSEDMMDVLNGWVHVLDCIRAKTGRQLSPFCDLSTSLKVIAGTLVTQGIALAVGINSILFRDMPVCWLTVANNLGWIPHGVIPYFVWQLLFFPLEMALSLPPMFSASFGGITFLVGLGVLKMFANEIR